MEAQSPSSLLPSLNSRKRSFRQMSSTSVSHSHSREGTHISPGPSFPPPSSRPGSLHLASTASRPSPAPSMEQRQTANPNTSRSNRASHADGDVIDLTLDDSPPARSARPAVSPARGVRLVPLPRHRAGPRRPQVIDLETSDPVTEGREGAQGHTASAPSAFRDASSQTPRRARHARPLVAQLTTTSADDDGDLEITSWNRLRVPEERAPDTMEPAVNLTPLSFLQQMIGWGPVHPPEIRQRSGHAHRPRRPQGQSVGGIGGWMRRTMPVALNAVDFLDYEAVGFPLSDHVPEPEPEAFRLDALPPARSGFTRELNEGDRLVCPNCDGELAAGAPDGQANVWVVRACGHVYCGVCGDKSNRAVRGAKAKAKDGKGKETKGKERLQYRDDGTSVRPLTACVVDGCQSKTTSEKSMFCLYL